MLITYDETIDMMNKGLCDSFLCVELMVGDSVIERMCTPTTFVNLCFFEYYIDDLKKYIKDSVNEKRLTSLRIRLFLKEGKKHDRIQINYALSSEKIYEMRPFMSKKYIEGMFQIIIKNAIEKLLE
jgi:hypothetical protein